MKRVHEAWELEQMQCLPLEIKVKMSKQRIQQWYEAFDGKVFVSFSGGKDSTVLLHLVREMFPDVEAVFADTGLEYPEIREFVKKWDNVTIIKPEMNFRDAVLKYGYPLPSKELARKIYYARKGSEWAQKWAAGDAEGEPTRYRLSNRWKKLLEAPFAVSDYCCYVTKKRPFAKFQRNGKVPMVGTMACESMLRKQAWMRTGCNAYTGKKHSMPLAFWTQNDVLEYLFTNKIQIASVYGDIVETGEYKEIFNGCVPEYKTTGVERTGCMFCMFGVHMEKSPNRFERMKETHPAQYEWCMKSVDEGGLGLDDVLNYVNIKH